MKFWKSKKNHIVIATMFILGTPCAYSAEWKEATGAFKPLTVLMPDADPIPTVEAPRPRLIDLLDSIKEVRRLLPASHHLKAAERSIKRVIKQHRKIDAKAKDPEESE